MKSFFLDLSGKRQRLWAKQIRKRFILAIFLLIIFALCARTIAHFALLNHTKNQALQQEKIDIMKQNQQLTQHIQQLQQNQTLYIQNSIESEKIIHWLDRIEKLPLKQGGLETLSFNQNDGLYLRLTGKVANQTEFEQMTTYLKQWQPQLKIEHFQQTEQQKIAFSLLVEDK